MKKIYLIASLALISTTLRGQNIEDILKQIERNNTTLKAKYESSMAMKITASSDRFMNNPEVEFAYMWGSPNTPGNRVDVSIKQSFDFPSVYVQKNHIAKIEGQMADLSYDGAKIELMIQSRRLCIELTYLNAMLQELTTRQERSEKLSSIYDKLLKGGSATAIQTSKAQMSLLQNQSNLSIVALERESVLSQLQSLNGGVRIEFNDAKYKKADLPSNFDDWFEQVADKNPAMEYLRKQIEADHRQIKLATAKGLPAFALGYKSESVGAGEQFQGIMASVSIPLWENKNRVKAARANLRASQSAEVDMKFQFYQELRNDYQKAIALQSIDERFHRLQQMGTNIELLEKALIAGEISLLDFLVEIGSTYEMIDQDWINERDFQLLSCRFLVYNS